MSTLRLGPAPARARLAMILVHGRGGSADDMSGIAEALRLDDVAYVVPEAPGRTWYPLSFLAPIEQNEPHLSRALATLDGLVSDLAREGVAADRIGLLGFSQGACLALEYAARHARRYAAIVGLSGGLIGPPGTARDYAGSFDATPVFLGCSDVDPHIPIGRVKETAEVFGAMHASVDARIYPGMGHVINQDELAAAVSLLSAAST